MLIDVQNPKLQTIFFTILFSLTLAFSAKRIPPELNLSKNITNELKGLSILMIVFGHIGYFLAKDTSFLWPLSIASGVGVNLFLFLSGFGLTKSQVQKKTPILKFYKNRVLRLFIPLWIVLIILYLADYYILGKTYDQTLTLKSFFGFFPDNDIYSTVNSSFWFVTLIIFYYVTFPFAFIGKLKYFSPLLIYLLSKWVLSYDLPVKLDTQKLYELHKLAFPLGVFIALTDLYFEKFKPLIKIRINSLLLKLKYLRYFSVLILAYIFSYFAIYSGVGTDPHLEEITSIFLMFLLVAIFVLSGFTSRFLGSYGKYSYGIYLIHWPLLYRYDLFYKFLPASIATFVYLFVFLVLAKYLEQASTFKRS